MGKNASRGAMKKFQKSGAATGVKRRPVGKPKNAASMPKKNRGQKRKADAPPPQPKAAGREARVAIQRESGDADDFMDMLDSMEDYKPPADASGGESDLEPEGHEAQEQQPGSDSDAQEGQQEAAEGAETGGKRAKKRRKGGQKLSALEFEARRAMVRQIADAPAEEQADWLWASYQQHAAASALERGGLTAQGMAVLPPGGSLEDQLRALEPDSWQQEFCGGGKGRGGGSSKGGEERPPGSPSLLLVSPSAVGSVKLIKLCPQFHKACRIAKLFAKHMKVAEQEELLRTQVCCIGVGTPNRLCKLADGGALQLDRLRHVVLDVQLDAKQRDLLAIPETRADWWQLYERHLKERLAAGSIKLSLVNSDRLG